MKKIYKLSLMVLALGFGVISCQKDNLVTDVPHNEDPDKSWGQGDSIPIVSPYYFKGKIDSVLYTLQDSIKGQYNLVFDSTYTACSGGQQFYGQLTGMYSLGGFNTLEIKFLKCIDDPTDAQDQASLMFVGTFPYGNSNVLHPIGGVEISWIDDDGKLWKSLPGSGSSSNDSFQIYSISAAPSSVLGNLVLLGRMDVTLYNATESIRIENGEFQFQYGIY